MRAVNASLDWAVALTILTATVVMFQFLHSYLHSYGCFPIDIRRFPFLFRLRSNVDEISFL